MRRRIFGLESWLRRSSWQRKWVWHQWVNQFQKLEHERRDWEGRVEHWRVSDTRLHLCLVAPYYYSSWWWQRFEELLLLLIWLVVLVLVSSINVYILSFYTMRERKKREKENPWCLILDSKRYLNWSKNNTYVHIL